MSDLVWVNVTVRLGALKPWANNPRFSTKAQAKRLLESWKELGQFQTVAIGPECDVYDGHQRLSALLTVYGLEYEIDARQSNRALTDEERKRLVITAHVGAVGSWDWNALSGWDAPQLREWGMDGDALRSWNLDALNLREMLTADNPAKEWEGMPEFENEDQQGIIVKVHFVNSEDREEFFRKLEVRFTDKTKSIWYPERPEHIKNQLGIGMVYTHES